MKNEIKVPSLGESISEATIGQILAPTGTLVKADAEILELETDKVNQVLYAPQAGRIHLTVKSGDTVKIGQTIGTIEPAAAEAEAPKAETSSFPAPPLAQTPAIPKAAEPKEVKPEPQRAEPAAQSSPLAAPVCYTKEEFLADLETAEMPIQKEALPVQAQPEPQLKKVSSERETRRPMSKIRKVIAQRLVEAQRTMAMLTTFNEIDLTHVIQLREKYKDAFTKKHGCKLGFMSFFVKATIAALQAYPDLNSYIDGEDIVHREYYDIGVAVGTDKGVIVPVIRDCDQLSYAEIEQAIENYAKKAREGTLTARDLQGGGFTITNGGIYGSLLSTPILLPPQCGILGMHKIEKRPVVINDQITIRSMMYVALSYDHRLIDGKEAVSFLVHIKNMLEDPSRLLLDI
jgi:2-oxoglutarate dehydrogenase E2 component (dihydrolipoamide succinyltransferase)